MERDIYLINNWLDKNELQVNESQTDLILLGSPSNLKKIGEISISAKNAVIASSETIKILGFHLDNKLTQNTYRCSQGSVLRS